MPFTWLGFGFRLGLAVPVVHLVVKVAVSRGQLGGDCGGAGSWANPNRALLSAHLALALAQPYP